MKNKIYIYSVWDMTIRKILTMSRPCPHQQHSLKETIRSNVLPDMCVGPVMNCGRKLSSISSQNILSIAWLPALKETGKSVDQLIGGKLTPPTKTMELNSALFGREKLKSWRISSEEPGGQLKVYMFRPLFIFGFVSSGLCLPVAFWHLHDILLYHVTWLVRTWSFARTQHRL